MHNTQGATPAPSTDTFEITEAGRDAVELREALVAAVKLAKTWYITAMRQAGAELDWDAYLRDDVRGQKIRAALLKHCVHEWPIKNSVLFAGEKR